MEIFCQFNAIYVVSTSVAQYFNNICRVLGIDFNVQFLYWFKCLAMLILLVDNGRGRYHELKPLSPHPLNQDAQVQISSALQNNLARGELGVKANNRECDIVVYFLCESLLDVVTRELCATALFPRHRGCVDIYFDSEDGRIDLDCLDDILKSLLIYRVRNGGLAEPRNADNISCDCSVDLNRLHPVFPE